MREKEGAYQHAEEVVLVHLMQADFTIKKGKAILPNLKYKGRKIRKQIKKLQAQLVKSHPKASIIWSLPVVRRFKVPEEIATAKQAVHDQKKMAKRQLKIKKWMIKKSILVFDLSQTYGCGPNRVPFNHSFTYDGIHPTGRGVAKFFKQLKTFLMKKGILQRAIKNRGWRND
jgi:lysophospholipase L1-like esterase